MTIPPNDNFMWIEPDFTSTGLWHYEDGAAVPVFPEDLPLRPETATRLQEWQDWFESEYDPNHLWATEARKQEFEREAWRLWRMLRDDLSPDFEVGHRLLYNRDFSPDQAELEYERIFGHPAYPPEPPAEIANIINDATNVNRAGFERAATLARQGEDLLDTPEWAVIDQVVWSIWYADGGKTIRDELSWEHKARATMHLYDSCPTWWVGSTLQDFWNELPEPVQDEFWSWTLVTLRRPKAFSRPLGAMMDVQWADWERPIPEPVADLLYAIGATACSRRVLPAAPRPAPAPCIRNRLGCRGRPRFGRRVHPGTAAAAARRASAP